MATTLLRLILVRYLTNPISAEGKGLIRHSHGRIRHNITLLTHFNGIVVNSSPENSNKDITEVFPATLITELSKPGIFQSVYEGYAIHSVKICGKCGDDPAYQLAYLWLEKLEEEELTRPFNSRFKTPVVEDEDGIIHEAGYQKANIFRVSSGQALGRGKRWKPDAPPEAEQEADLDGATEVELEWKPAEETVSEEE